MPCYHPVQGYKGRRLTENGKRPLVFRKEDGFVDLPVQVPCGWCIGCRIRRTQEWKARLMAEKQAHAFSWFLTLTYEDSQLPPGGTLVKDHLRLFWRRLRKAFPSSTIRYLACGEYGDRFSRPHYHATVFGFPLDDLKFQRMAENKRDKLYSSRQLEALWGHGLVWIGTVTGESAGYVAKYILKKVTGEAATAEYGGRVPPFLVCSLKPGIGRLWFDRYWEETYRDDFVIVGGQKSVVPRVYGKWMEVTDPARLLEVKWKRIRRANTRVQRMEAGPVRLAEREIVKLAAVNLTNRGDS